METEFDDLFASKIPDETNSASMSIRMHLERDIDILASLKCRGEL